MICTWYHSTWYQELCRNMVYCCMCCHKLCQRRHVNIHWKGSSWEDRAITDNIVWHTPADYHYLVHATHLIHLCFNWGLQTGKGRDHWCEFSDIIKDIFSSYEYVLLLLPWVVDNVADYAMWFVAEVIRWNLLSSYPISPMYYKLLDWAVPIYFLWI